MPAPAWRARQCRSGSRRHRVLPGGQGRVPRSRLVLVAAADLCRGVRLVSDAWRRGPDRRRISNKICSATACVATSGVLRASPLPRQARLGSARAHRGTTRAADPMLARPGRSPSSMRSEVTVLADLSTRRNAASAPAPSHGCGRFGEKVRRGRGPDEAAQAPQLVGLCRVHPVVVDPACEIASSCPCTDRPRVPLAPPELVRGCVAGWIPGTSEGLVRLRDQPARDGPGRKGGPEHHDLREPVAATASRTAFRLVRAGDPG